MKYVIDNHTGKRFYYNSPATWTLEGRKYNTVARIPTKGHISTLHPTRLSPKDFQRLNNKEQRPMNKKELLHQAIDQLTNLEKAASEYRWENRAIGQGHYFTDLWDCIQNALTFSKTRPCLRETLLIEQFRPFRKELLLIQNGCLYTTQTPPREKEASEEDRKLKAAVLTIERLRNFFDGPNFVQADLTRDGFYKIITASKLEANGHKEQK